MKSYDAIVVGVGGIGSAALYHLALRGLRVLGLDRFPPGHDRGSSHGQTRVIRKAYFEHPGYVPLMQRAYELWSSLDAVSSTPLFHPCGLLEVGPPDGLLIRGVREAARRFALPLEELTPQQVEARFPGFRIPDGSASVYEPQGGYLMVEDCVRRFVNLAAQHSAELAVGNPVQSWQSDGKQVIVHCGDQVYRARRLVVASGAWAGQLLADLNIEFRLLRKHLHWYRTHAASDYLPTAGSPVFFYHTPDGYYYGFPSLDGRSLKVAEHSGGSSMSDPLNPDQSVDIEERRRVENFLQRHLSRVHLDVVHHSVCMYTMTADEHFVVDRHPRYDNVCFAAGLSGHGFKFASVLGEILADLAEHGTTPLPIDFLSTKRFIR